MHQMDFTKPILVKVLGLIPISATRGQRASSQQRQLLKQSKCALIGAAFHHALSRQVTIFHTMKTAYFSMCGCEAGKDENAPSWSISMEEPIPTAQSLIR